MSKAKTSILNDYKPAANEVLNETHVIKEFFGKTDRYGKFVVYTDGAAIGSSETHDKRSFAGWGFHFKDHLPGGRIKEGQKFGHLFNADPEEAELRAVIEALQFNNHPSHFEIVSDCANVVEGFVNIHEKIGEFHEMAKKGRDQRLSTAENRKFSHLRLWKQMFDEVNMNSNIVSLSARWVRSHTLEDGHDVKVSDFDTPGEKRIVGDILGNDQADKCATLGTIKAVRSALFFYLNVKTTDAAKERSIRASRKNFEASHFAQDEAVKFLSQQPEDFLPKEIVERILPSECLEKLNTIREEVNNGADIKDSLNSVINSSRSISFSENKSNNAFVNRIMEGHKNSSSATL